MRTTIKAGLVACCLTVVTVLGAAPGSAQSQPQYPVFLGRLEVAADAQARLGRRIPPERDPAAGSDMWRRTKATTPVAANYLSFEGDVVLVYSSINDFGAIRVGTIDARFECDNQATPLGCAALSTGNHIIVYAHLRSYPSCRHDATDDEAVVNLIYRRTHVHSGDLTYEVWTLLTQ